MSCKNIFLFLLVSTLLVSPSGYASDHIDGVPSLGDHPQVDLTDLYAFITPNNEKSLTVILNSYPGVVVGSGHYSSKVSYEVEFRPVQYEKIKIPLKPRFNHSSADSSKVTCTFVDPTSDENTGTHLDLGKVSCEFRKGEKVLTVASGSFAETLKSPSGNFKIQASYRADPFFIDAGYFKNVTERVKFGRGVSSFFGNTMNGFNVLSLAIEIDFSLFSGGPGHEHGNDEMVEDQLLAVAAASYINESSQDDKVQLDRVGRPEITNLSLHDWVNPATGNGTKELKVAYNKFSNFSEASVSENELSKDFQARLRENILNYDLLGGGVFWGSSEGGSLLDSLTSLLLDDFLVINLDPNCFSSGNDYFAIEKYYLKNSEGSPLPCGGRQLTDNIMNTLYSLYIEGLYSELTYGTPVTIPYKRGGKKLNMDQFPYLASPWGKPGRLKARLLKQFQKAQEGGGHSYDHSHGH